MSLIRIWSSAICSLTIFNFLFQLHIGWDIIPDSLILTLLLSILIRL